MGMVEVGWPTGVAVLGRVAVERFAVLVGAVGAGVGRLQVADTVALLVTTVPHDRLAIVGDNLAILFVWVLLPDLRWSDVDASGGWRAWIISRWTLQGCRSWGINRMAASSLVVVNELYYQLPNELCRGPIRYCTGLVEQVGIHHTHGEERERFTRWNHSWVMYLLST